MKSKFGNRKQTKKKKEHTTVLITNGGARARAPCGNTLLLTFYFCFDGSKSLFLLNY